MLIKLLVLLTSSQQRHFAETPTPKRQSLVLICPKSTQPVCVLKSKPQEPSSVGRSINSSYNSCCFSVTTQYQPTTQDSLAFPFSYRFYRVVLPDAPAAVCPVESKNRVRGTGRAWKINPFSSFPFFRLEGTKSWIWWDGELKNTILKHGA